MARIAGKILIARPVEVVFDCVADQRNEPKYNPRMVRSERLTDGPIGVGTRFGATMTSGRRRTDMVVETTEYDRPRRLASKITMDMADDTTTPRSADSFDNALAESTIGQLKAELVHRRGPWRTIEQVEFALLEYIDWWNHRRLHGEIGMIPPVEEAAYYRHTRSLQTAGSQ